VTKNESKKMSAVVVEVSTSAAKGRALVAARDVVAGEVVVDELPILLSVYDDAKGLACARCLRALNGGGDGSNGVPCLSCRQVAFCSAACAAAAEREPWVHAPATCRAYAAGLAALPEAPPATSADNDNADAAAATEARSALRFLIQALALRALAMQQHAASGQADPITSEGAARYAQLLSLCVAGGPAASAAASAVRALLPALAAAVGGVDALPPEDEIAALLSREQANSFAVEAPPLPPSKPAAPKKKGGASGPSANAPKPPRRRLLGGALYAHASLVNHECLPNVARFDDFVPTLASSAAAGSSPLEGPATAVQGRLRLVALHALPKGTELALSYTPLRWPAAKRRAHCREVYGFDCACPRCALEARADVFRDARGGGGGGQEGDDGSDWETDDEDEEDEDGEWETEEGGEADMEEEEEEGGGAGGGGDAEAAGAGGATTTTPAAMDPTYLHLFLLKYVCPRKGCTGGTLAPVAPGQADVLRCNACGGERTEAEFLAELNG
jgi:SET and MYND domain-containing protein